MPPRLVPKPQEPEQPDDLENQENQSPDKKALEPKLSSRREPFKDLLMQLK